MPNNNTAGEQAEHPATPAVPDIPEKAVALADLHVALPESLTPLLLVDAKFFQYGQLLLIKLADGRLLLVTGYFPDAPDLGLPTDLAVAGPGVDMVMLDAPDFTNYLNNLTLSDPTLVQSLSQQIAEAGPWPGLVNVAGIETTGIEAPADAGNTGDAPAQADLASLEVSEIADDKATDAAPQAGENTLDALPGSPDSGTGGNEPVASSSPDAGALGSLSSLSLGGLGGGGSSLGSLGGTAGSMQGVASVDGFTGVGGTTSIGGSLGSAASLKGVSGNLGSIDLSLAPQSDALASGTSGQLDSQTGLFGTPTIRFSGTMETSVADLNYRTGGGNSIISIVGSSSTDSITFTDSENWINTYSPLNTLNTSGTATPQVFSTVTFNGLSLTQYSNNTLVYYDFSITITGIGTVNIDLSSIASTEPREEIANLINANPILSGAGITAYWVDKGFGGDLVVSDPSTREITAASINDAGGISLSTTVTNLQQIQSITELTFSVPNYVPHYPGDNGFYNPDARHGADIAIVTQTNIGRYETGTFEEHEDQVAVGGAQNPDVVRVFSGGRDYDSLSFYDPTPGREYTGNGDYDLVSNNAYLKFSGFAHIEARGYGDNVIRLNQAAVDFIGDLEQFDVTGDANDRVEFTDASNWKYNGTLAEHVRSISFLNPNTGSTLRTANTDLGNIQYQYISADGTSFVNISADILDHPDWYWVGGTSGDDAYELPDTQFGSIDFGAGVDTLELNSGLTSKTQDFRGEGGDLANVEIINTTNQTAVQTINPDGTVIDPPQVPVASVDSVIVDRAFVTGATDSNNTLSIIGDSIDSVTVSDIATDWTFLGSVAGSGGLSGYIFNQYAYRPGETSEVILNIESELAGSIPDYYRGWEGDDILNVFDGGYMGIDGGAGTDAIKVNAATQNYSMATNVANIEVIDGSAHAGATAFTISEAFVDLQGGVLTVMGDGGSDTLSLSDTANWSWSGTVSVLGITAYQYRSVDGTAVLNVQQNFATTPGIFFNGTSGDDTFTAPDLNFISLDGKAGTDWLEVMSDDYDFTAAGVADKIDNLEVIDSRAHSGASTVTLDLTSVAAMTDADNKIHVLGDANDSVVISDLETNWSYIAHVDGIDDFTSMRFYQYQSLDGTHIINIYDQILNRPDVRIIGDIGGASSDILVAEDLTFSLVDGRSGTDTLVVEQAGNLDYTGLGSKIDNLEAIDLSGTATGATLSADFVRDATDANNQFVVQGDNSDSITLADAGNWNYRGVIDASAPWDALYVYQGTASGGETVFLYQETNVNNGNVLVDAVGTSGDDLFRFASDEDANLDAGLGTDTLTFAASGTTKVIDFTTGTTISGIEILDLRNSSQENVTFDLGSVGQSDNNAVFVLGDAGLDHIDVSNDTQWTIVGRAQFSDAPDMYAYFGSGGEALYVQTDLVQDLFRLSAASAGDDVFRVIDTNFGALNGGGGAFDRVNFLQEGSIDLANLGGSSLTSVEVVDTTNGVANDLSLSAASIEGTATYNQFYVLGENGDTLTLNAADNWSYQNTLVVSPDLTLDSYTSVATGGLTVYVDSQVTISIA